MPMEYLKKHLSLEQQADLLLSRGLIADRNALISRLSHVGYYRFSAYTHPYRKRDAQGRALDQFVNGSHLDDVWFHYCFDRKLRLHLLDAIERIEICLRSAVAYFHSEFSPYGLRVILNRRFTKLKQNKHRVYFL